MNKITLILICIVISGCDRAVNRISNDYPKFKVGDCVKPNQERESWEKDKEITDTSLIVEIGKNHYRMCFSDGKVLYVGTQDFIIINDIAHKVECPKNLTLEACIKAE